MCCRLSLNFGLFFSWLDGLWVFRKKTREWPFFVTSNQGPTASASHCHISLDHLAKVVFPAFSTVGFLSSPFP